MPKDMYVVKLSFSDYADFAQWLTEDVGGGVRRHELPPGQLNAEIEAKLKTYPARVHEHCDPKEPTRTFGQDDDGNAWGCDRIVTHRDSIVTQQAPNSANLCHTHMAMPDKICLDAKGNIDLTYLKAYVADLCNASEEDAAWSLLGMYFLSRCK